MKHYTTRYYYLMALCLLTGCTDSTGFFVPAVEPKRTLPQADGQLQVLDAQGTPLQELPSGYGEYRLVVNTDQAWQLTLSSACLQAERTSGCGPDTLWLLVGSNWSEAREADIVLTTGHGDATRSADGESWQLTLSQAGTSQLNEVAEKVNSSMGAGYTYSPAGKYCMGTGIQIFNLQNLAKIGREYNTQLLNDDYYPSLSTKIYQSDSLDVLQTQLSIDVTADIDLKLFTANLSGAFNQQHDETNSRSYAVQRLQSTLFSRELHYMNVLGLIKDHPEVRNRIFAAGFLMLHDELVQRIANCYGKIENEQGVCAEFVRSVGPCFVSKAMLGCGMDYYTSIEKKELTDEITVDAMLKFKWQSTFNINADASGHYNETTKKKTEKMTANFDIRGGDISEVSILNSGGALPYKELMTWTLNLTPRQAVLTDMRLEPIYLLFTDKATSNALRTYIESQQ